MKGDGDGDGLYEEGDDAATRIINQNESQKQRPRDA